MSTIDDKATVSLFVNGEQAEQAMTRLSKRANELKTAIQAADEAGNLKEYKKLQRELDKVNKEMGRCQSTAKGVGIVLNDLSNASIHGLRNTLKYLQKELKLARPDSEVWRRYSEQIGRVKARLDELTGKINENQSAWERFKKWSVSVWPAIDLISRGYNSVINGMRDSVDAFAEMDQEMANVRKFTGMTEQQVADLNEEFKKIDTRSGRDELNRLAQEAGRLGKTSEEDVLGFVRAADQINVALDDLGDGATLTLSKLTGIFGDEQRYGTEQSLLKVGSVINELSQNCSASAPYLAEFSSRLGGVGAQAGMTIQQIMGFGAVLDSNAQKVEASATALSQIIVRLYQEPAKYAKVAGLDVEKFSRLMREDANAALILFLETLQKAGGMDVLSPMFKDMGENGSRAVAALSTLATHIDQVKAQQQVANQAFEEGTSVTKEFTVQNTTAQASLEKHKKRAQELRIELGEKLYPVMGYLLISSSALMHAMLTTIEFISRNKAEILSLVVAISAYMVVVNAQILKTKTLLGLKSVEIAYNKVLVLGYNTLKGVVLLVNAAYSALSGNMAKATVAMRTFNIVTKANPLGLLAAALSAAIVWISRYISKTKDAQKAEREAAAERKKNADDFKRGLRDISRETAEYADKEVRSLKKAYEAAIDDTKSKKERIAAVNELKKMYPDYFGQLSTEAILVGEAGKQYEDLTKKIMKAAKARAAQDKVYENEKLRLEKEMELDQTQDSIEETATRRNDLQNKYDNKLHSGNAKKIKEAKELRPELDEVKQSLDELNDREYQLVSELAEIDKTNEWLANKYEANIEDAKKKALEASTVIDQNSTQSTPYVSTTQSEKDKKKNELEQRRALAKAKAEFKQQMEQAKGDYESGSAQNVVEYGEGLKSYEDFLAEKERLDLQYINDRIEIYDSLYAGESDTDKKLLKLYDEDYQEFLLKRAELTKKHQEAQSKRSVDDLQRQYKMEVSALEFEFNSPNSKYYGDSKAQQQRLHELKIDYLMLYQKQYKKNSKEWLDYERQITDAEQADMLERRKAYMQKYEEFAASYTSLSAQRKYDIELAMVEALYKQRKISEEDYQLWLVKLREKYREDSNGASSKRTETKYTVDGPGGKIDIRSDDQKHESRIASLNKDRDDAIAELNQRFADGLISQEELDQGLSRVEKAYQKALLDPVRSMLDEQTRMLFDLGVAWSDFFAGISENGKLSFDDITTVAQTSVATLCAGLQTYSQFLEAQTRIDIANVEKRYEKEIEYAQGNSYKVAKAEKKKERETQKIKSAAAKKEFAVKILMAIAQTAQNTLMGYSAGLQFPFPANTVMPGILAGLATAQGLIQIALLKKQQQAAAAEGYSKGGFTKPGPVNEPAGVVHAGEWVASQRLLANPVARPMIEALDYAQRTNTIGTLRAEDVSRSIRANDSLVRMAESDGSSALMVAAAVRMSQTVDSLTDRLNEPFVTVNTVSGDKGIKKAQDDYTRLMNNITPKSKRK